MTTYLLDASSYNSQGRPFGVSRYAYHLALAFDRIKAELEADERLLVATHLRGPNAITDDLRIDRYLDAAPASYRSYNRDRRRHFARTLRRSGADLVHFVEGPKLIGVRGLPAIVTCQDLIPLMYPEHYLRHSPERFVRRLRDYTSYCGARRVIATSKITADVLVDRLRLARERITVIPLGVDHDRFHAISPVDEPDAIRDAYALPPRYAIYVGATDWRKRVDLLLACYQDVFRATGVPLALVGAEFAPAKHAAIARALEAAAAGSVIVIGEVAAERLPALYRQAALHVLPSIYEGFGLTVLEAMACGCPVVAAAGGAIPEVTADAARLVAADDGGALAAAIRDLLNDPAARDRLRQRGLERARAFTWERTAHETLVLYRRATGRDVSSPLDRVAEDRARQQRQQP